MRNLSDAATSLGQAIFGMVALLCFIGIMTAFLKVVFIVIDFVWSNFL